MHSLSFSATRAGCEHNSLSANIEYSRNFNGFQDVPGLRPCPPAAVSAVPRICPSVPKFAQVFGVNVDCGARYLIGWRQRKTPQTQRVAGSSMVGVGRIELPTPAMSTQCSTTELYAHFIEGSLTMRDRRSAPITQGYLRRKRFARAAVNGLKPALRASRRTGVRPPAPDRAGERVWTKPWPLAVLGSPARTPPQSR